MVQRLGLAFYTDSEHIVIDGQTEWTDIQHYDAKSRSYYTTVRPVRLATVCNSDSNNWHIRLVDFEHSISHLAV